MDIRTLTEQTLGYHFPCPVQEVEAGGLYVQYQSGAAQVGGSTVPALARAYMLLAKELSAGKTDFEIRQSASFKECGIMLDVSFGCVLKVASVKKYMDFMALHGMNLLMLYTEDLYEVPEYPHFGYQRGRYSAAELREVVEYASQLGIEVVPCIQTFGHLGKFLRYAVNGNIAENATVLLPGEEKTYQFIEACIRVCRSVFTSNRIHIGCDETRGVGFGKSFNRDGYRDRFDIFNEHLSRVVEICQKYSFHPMMWSDMYFAIAAPNAGTFEPGIEVPQYAIDAMPDVDLVFWDYYHEDNHFYAANIESHKKIGHNYLFAGGVWTWNGPVPNFRYTYDTVRPAMEECLKGGVESVFGTTWAYGDINHMQGLPCLAMYSEYCWRGMDCTREDVDAVAEFTTGTSRVLADAISDFFCGLEGDYKVGTLILFSDPLINLLCYDYDLPAYEKCFANSLKVLEQHPEAPFGDYYRAIFRCVLHKVRLHQTLIPRYKAGDKAWLREYAEVTLPQMQKDFQTLFELHDELWHRDQKTYGFERCANWYAAAISRIGYTAKQIKRYLNGEITEIEALEQEPLRGSKQKYLGVDRVMNTLA